MGELLTENLGLIKPNRDTNTPLDIERLNLNMDKLDSAARVANVPDGTIPPTAELFDGKIVREKASGGTWVAEKQTNGSFAKKWLVYPYLYIAYMDPTGIPASGTWIQWGWNLFWGGSYNATVNDLSTAGGLNFWKVPFKGIFQMRYNDQFQPTGTGGQVRASCFSINGTREQTNTETSHINNFGTTQDNTATYSRVLNQGDIVGHELLIGQGANPTLYSTIEVNCIERLSD